MKSFNESEIKYLAGLLDADGWLHIRTYKTTQGNEYLRLEMGLQASESVDKHGYVKSLGERAGSVSTREFKKHKNWSTAYCWKVGKMNELNQLIPRLTKHMVIKAKHWQRLFDFYHEHRGQSVDGEFVRLFSDESRLDTGPLKPKKHPTWGWVAGYLDGDGCYSLTKKRCLRVDVVSHENDTQGLYLLQKAFGGYVRPFKKENKPWYIWSRNLGAKDKSFALNFLPKVLQHSRLKKHKIEQLIAFHNHSQRLIELPPTGEDTV